MKPFRTRINLVALCAFAALLFLAAGNAMADPPVSGAIFTTDSTCTQVNGNIYVSKDAVYLNGGPGPNAPAGAAGLPDGDYYVKVTAPDGTLLGTSLGSANPTPVNVTNGVFGLCYPLSAIVVKASNPLMPGYDDTPNSGGEYKVWVSNVSTFNNNSTKTDNFKVGPLNPTPCDSFTITVKKFFDGNADGINNDGLGGVNGVIFKLFAPDNTQVDQQTTANGGLATFTIPNTSPSGSYTVEEVLPTGYVNTTPIDQTVSVLFNGNCSAELDFGDYCLVPSGGLTLGFWSNKNGETLMTGSATGTTLLPGVQSLLRSLSLRNANGTYFYTGTTSPPTGSETKTYAQFRTWILGATATNMAYMLSAQLATMELNVYFHKVDGNAFDLCSGETINALMTEANTSLGANGNTTAAGAARSYQERLKNCLDALNNGTSVIPTSPCPVSYPSP